MMAAGTSSNTAEAASSGTGSEGALHGKARAAGVRSAMRCVALIGPNDFCGEDGLQTGRHQVSADGCRSMLCLMLQIHTANIQPGNLSTVPADEWHGIGCSMKATCVGYCRSMHFLV